MIVVLHPVNLELEMLAWPLLGNGNTNDWVFHRQNRFQYSANRKKKQQHLAWEAGVETVCLKLKLAIPLVRICCWRYTVGKLAFLFLRAWRCMGASFGTLKCLPGSSVYIPQQSPKQTRFLHEENSVQPLACKIQLDYLLLSILFSWLGTVNSLH